MKKLDVAHFLGIYQLRLRMHEDRSTNSNEEVKAFMRDFVDTLSKMPLDEEVKILGKSFVDSKGAILATLPLGENKNT